MEDSSDSQGSLSLWPPALPPSTIVFSGAETYSLSLWDPMSLSALHKALGSKWVLSMSLTACQLALSEADTGEGVLVRAGLITIVREAANTPHRDTGLHTHERTCLTNLLPPLLAL